jgi:aromatic ring-cleaving dioxygenase
MKWFHAHIYYQNDQVDEIKKLEEAGRASPLKVWKLFDQRVGPHDLPMLELHFNGESELAAVEWLKNHHGNLSVLIHEDTGDECTLVRKRASDSLRIF